MSAQRLLALSGVIELSLGSQTFAVVAVRLAVTSADWHEDPGPERRHLDASALCVGNLARFRLEIAEQSVVARDTRDAAAGLAHAHRTGAGRYEYGQAERRRQDHHHLSRRHSRHLLLPVLNVRQRSI